MFWNCWSDSCRCRILLWGYDNFLFVKRPICRRIRITCWKPTKNENTEPLTIKLSVAYPYVSGNFLIPIILFTFCVKVEVLPSLKPTACSWNFQSPVFQVLCLLCLFQGGNFHQRETSRRGPSSVTFNTWTIRRETDGLRHPDACHPFWLPGLERMHHKAPAFK